VSELIEPDLIQIVSTVAMPVRNTLSQNFWNFLGAQILKDSACFVRLAPNQGSAARKS